MCALHTVVFLGNAFALEVASCLGLMAYTPHPAFYTLHPTPYTLHPTPCSLHPTPHTVLPTPYTPHPTPYTLHPTPHTPLPTPYDLHLNMCYGGQAMRRGDMVLARELLTRAEHQVKHSSAIYRKSDSHQTVPFPMSL